jgi:aryl-alcohol dehydrogenase-like predicted oxidoreductase
MFGKRAGQTPGGEIMTVLQPDRLFGATGIKVPLIGYGTAPLGKEKKIPREVGVRCLHHAIDRGITYLDTSPDYGSEPVVGEVMKTRRDEVFLATKINRRSYSGVMDEIHESLAKLQTDHLDLIQVHAVNAWADWEQAKAEDGALKALEEARDQGLVRFIGITGHARPAILAQAIEDYPFDSVLVALGIADRLISNPQHLLLPVAEQQHTAVIAMKVFGHGEFQRRDLALRYSLGLPAVSMAIIGLDNEQQIDEVVEMAADFDILSDAEEDELIASVRPLVEEDAQVSSKGEGKSKLFWLHDTTVMGWSQHDEPVLVEY